MSAPTFSTARTLSRRSSLRTRAVALGILVVASIVGNVSMSASRTRGEPVAAGYASPGTAVGLGPGRDSAQPAADRGGDEGRLIPAIYSWDPDVTFVFYRHVAKWM